MMSKCLKCGVFLFLAVALRAGAQGTAFTYQGELATNGTPATGLFDFRFAVYDAATNGDLVSGLLTNAPVGVTNGLFTTTLDFGTNIFTGPPRWLDLGVRTNGATNAYTGLLPRQPFTAVPYAIFAGGASNLLGDLQATQLSGTISSSQITGAYTNAVSFNSVSNAFAGSFNGIHIGNGVALTNLNGSLISTGTVADVRLSANVAFLNGNQTFSGANTMSNWNNSFTGSFYGNGLVGWNTVSSNTINTVIDHGYVLTNSQLVSVTLPASPNIGDIIRLAGAGAGGWQIALTGTGQSILGSFLSYNNLPWNASAASSGNWYTIASSSDGSRLAAAIYGGGIYTSENFGSSWTENSPLTTAAWRSIASSSDGTKLLAVVYGGSMYLSTNTGTSWSAVSGSGSLDWISAASSADGTHLIAAVQGGAIYISTNSGASWIIPSSGLPSNPQWQSVAASSNGSNLVAAVNGGGIYTSANAGFTWSTSGAASLSWESVASSSSGTRLAAGSLAGFYYSTNTGTSWTRLSSGPATNSTGPFTNCYSVAVSADGSKLAGVIGGGGIYLSSNLGNSWTLQSGAPTTNWFAITMSSDGSHVAAAANGITPAGIIYVSEYTSQSIAATYTNGVYGSPGSALELQYIGSSQFMPVSSAGNIWGY